MWQRFRSFICCSFALLDIFLLTSCSKKSIYINDITLELFTTDNDSSLCRFTPSDDFKCTYEIHSNTIVFHLTINNSKYYEICEYNKSLIACLNLGNFKRD